MIQETSINVPVDPYLDSVKTHDGTGLTSNLKSHFPAGHSGIE
jgi:hypothetical protein